MIKEWIQEYKPASQQEAEFALREIMQEVALAGLHRSGFFKKAAFYGGTALRILYGLDRFSEDLDFSLLAVDPHLSLAPYFAGITMEFQAIGMYVSIREKAKSIESNVDSAFLKSDTVWRELVLEGVVPQAGVQTAPGIKIKLEVDRKPPLGFDTEQRLLLKPFSFYVNCFTLPNLFAGKMHTVLFRNWEQRVKGRDWYDLEWYIRKGVPLHLEHFLSRAKDSGNWTRDSISKAQFLQLLKDKIDAMSFDRVREDAVKFIPDSRALDVWSPQYFKDLTDKLKFN